ncbi:MAG: ABC transporter substrate-binding protein [Tepidamorphaceae bacterium]|nr:ABC transporter substrate-binding protein [Rhodobiaceae bacterium]MCC0049733.1 ABC transporter substrate-binding protein [Rhodobiaceae bacterium]
MKRLLTLTALASCLALGTAQAQEKTIYLGGYGGSFETLLKEKILPPFEAETGAKIVYVPGNSTDTLAKLQAQKGAQELDVAILDDGPMFQAIDFGFCTKIEDAAIFDDVYDIARMNTDKAIGAGFVATGFAYNAEYFEKEGWDPPSSWNDLTDPKYAGKLVVPPITNTYGLHALWMMAKLNGGDEKNIEPGFKVFEDTIAKNVLAFEPSSGKMSELFQNGEIVLSVWGSGRLKSLADTGFPGKFAYPKEGAVALMVAVCPVVDSDVPELSQKLVQHFLKPENQVLLAETVGFGPVNTKAELPPELAEVLPYGTERIEAMNAIDWTIVNPARGEWTKQWTRRVEQ